MGNTSPDSIRFGSGGATRRRGRQDMNKPTHGYAAFSKCGCITGVTVDYADKNTAQDVAEFIASGRRVERMLVSEINAIGFGCKCPKVTQPMMSFESETPHA